jgi:hypothetical protein
MLILSSICVFCSVFLSHENPVSCGQFFAQKQARCQANESVNYSCLFMFAHYQTLHQRVNYITSVPVLSCSRRKIYITCSLLYSTNTKQQSPSTIKFVTKKQMRFSSFGTEREPLQIRLRLFLSAPLLLARACIPSFSQPMGNR